MNYQAGDCSRLKGLNCSDFDWNIWDRQPLAIREFLGVRVHNGLHLRFVFPFSEALAWIAHESERLAELEAKDTLRVYGPDHPQAYISEKVRLQRMSNEDLAKELGL